MSTTFATLLTPAGRGAVASILVRGPEACKIVDRCFRPVARRAWGDCPWGRIVFGRWHASQQAETPGEEIVACRMSEGAVELHCHGGQVAAARILNDLAGEGCVLRGGISQSGQDGELLQREALIALAQARTERTAAILLDQYQGALERECRALRTLASDAHWDDVISRLDELLDWRAVGLHLASPWKVVLAGPPNVGKSSLINALLGYQRAIVFDQPGTTRDAVTAETAFAGWPVELSDTAGMRSTDDNLELAGIDQAKRQVAEADCLVLVFDASQKWSSSDQELLMAYPGALVLHNKADRAVEGERPDGLRTAALDGQGLPEMVAAIVDRLVPAAPPPLMAIPFTERQGAWLSEASQAAKSGDLDRLADCLRHLRSAEHLPH